MSPEAADFASAESAAGDPAVVAEPDVEEPDPEDPQPAAVSATPAKSATERETMDRCIADEDAARSLNIS
jgi:hypothetical protein